MRTFPLIAFIGSNHHMTSELVPFVFPSAVYAEKNGTFTNFEGRVQRIRNALAPLGESKSELEILTLLARKLGFDWPDENEQGVFEELRKHLPQSAKIMV